MSMTGIAGAVRAGGAGRSGRAPTAIAASGLFDAALAKAKLRLPVLIMLIAILVPVEFHIGSLSLTSLRLVLIVMVIPLLVGLFQGRFGGILPVDWLFMGHFIWLTVALAVNNPDKVVQQAGSLGIEFLGGYLMGRAYIRSREDFAALGKALIWSVVIMLPLTLYETKTGTPVIPTLLRKLPGISSVPIITKDTRLGLERVQGPFNHPIHFGLYCSVVFAIAFVAFDGIKSRLWRVVFSGLVLLSGFLALSSGALLSLLLQMGLIGWFLAFRRFAGRWWLLLGIFAVIYIGIDLVSNRGAIKVFLAYATFSSHTAYWRSLIFEWGMVNVWANPIFGLGLRDWVRPYYMYSGSMDNFWLVMAVRYGIPGFLLIATGYLWGMFKLMFRDFSTDPRLMRFRRAWVFTFFGLTFTLCTVHVWDAVYSFTFFMFGAGMWMLTESTPKAGPARAGQARRPAPDMPEAPGAEETPQPSRGPVYSRFAQTRRRG